MDELKEKKRADIKSMFDNIAWRYDFLNHFLSFGIDRTWRKKAVKVISKTHNPVTMLDVATGTGDLALAALKLNPEKITGLDISDKMLGIAREKIRKKGFVEKIKLIQGNSENIPFYENSFDVAMVAFGIRNFNNPLKGLSEMRRVIRHGGLIMVLEFSKPVLLPFRNLYGFYFFNILPVIGKIFSKDKEAYKYLPESVMNFPYNEEFISLIKQAGFVDAKQKKLTGGVVSIYTGIKP